MRTYALKEILPVKPLLPETFMGYSFSREYVRQSVELGIVP
jgi:hypothetical protein